MAWWSRRERRDVPTSGLAVPTDWLTEAFGTTAAPSGQTVSIQKVLGLAPVFSAVRLITGHVGQVPFKVYRANEDGDAQEARQHPAWRLLHDRPNSWTPAGQFWSTVATHLLLYGNAFIEKVGRGPGMELIILPPEEMTVRWWPQLRDKTFEHRPVDGRPPRLDLDPSDVLHIFKDSLDGIVGLSVIACKTSLGTALARDEYEGGFYKRGATLSGVVQTPRQMSKTAAQNLKDSLVSLFGGSPNSFGIGVLEEGAEWKAIGSPLKDLEFVQAQQMSRTDIAIMFNLPPNALGGSSGDNLHYSTVEMNQQEIAVNAVAPLTTTIAQAVSQDPSILPQNVFYGDFVLEGMMRGDAKTRAEVYQILWEIGAIDSDEIRKRENLPPLTPNQKAELAQRLAQKQQPAPASSNGNGAMPAINRS